MAAERAGWRAWLKAPLFSPLGLLLRAAGITVVFAFFEAFGLREYTTILCGSAPTGGPGDGLAAIFALAYILFWFLFVLGVPVLTLGAGFQVLLLMLGHREPPPPNEKEAPVS